MPAYGKRCDKCGKLNHLKDVYRSVRSSTVNTIEKENVCEQKPSIETVNISSVNFNSNHSSIIVNLKTSSNKATIMVSYQVDMGSNGNIMPFNIFTKLFLSTPMDQLAATKDATKLRTYNCKTITQLGRCRVEIENNDKQKMHILCTSRKWRSVIKHTRHQIVKHLKHKLQHNRNREEKKDVNYNIKKDSMLSTGNLQCYANTGLERS